MSESKINITKAIVAVMLKVKGVEKNMQVGSGNYGYKGVSDYEVKKIYSSAMAENGLCILPIDVEDEVTIDTWEEEYNGQKKRKQSVFTKVKTKYLLLHTSGESQVITGYGHGIDSQDKSAGKASTYALKYALLYIFLTPTGKIDDADTEHSEEKPSKPTSKTPTKPETKKEEKPKIKELIKPSSYYDNLMTAIQNGKVSNIEKVREVYTFSNEIMRDIEAELKKFKESKVKK